MAYSEDHFTKIISAEGKFIIKQNLLLKELLKKIWYTRWLLRSKTDFKELLKMLVKCASNNCLVKHHKILLKLITC